MYPRLDFCSLFSNSLSLLLTPSSSTLGTPWWHGLSFLSSWATSALVFLPFILLFHVTLRWRMSQWVCEEGQSKQSNEIQAETRTELVPQMRLLRLCPIVSGLYAYLDGDNHLQLNPTKTNWLWVFEPPRSGDIPDGVALSYWRVVHNFGVILNSQLLLDEQLTAVARKSFAQFHLVH